MGALAFNAYKFIFLRFLIVVFLFYLSLFIKFKVALIIFYKLYLYLSLRVGLIE